MPRAGEGKPMMGIRLVGQQGAGSYKARNCVKDFELYFAINEKPQTGSEQGSPLGKVAVAGEWTASWRQCREQQWATHWRGSSCVPLPNSTLGNIRWGA